MMHRLMAVRMKIHPLPLVACDRPACRAGAVTTRSAY